MPWAWDEKAARYRDTATGRFMPRQQVLSFVEQSITNGRPAVDQLAGYVANGVLSPADWRTAMRQEIKGEYIRQYMLGRGGQGRMTQTDWGSVGGMLKDQYKYLDQFAGELSGLSEKQIAARSQMYLSSAREAFERGNARAQGVPTDQLPAWPGDGSSCLGMTNCGCNWEFQEVTGDGVLTGWNCYWRLGATEHCTLCLDHAAQWAPYFIAI